MTNYNQTDPAWLETARDEMFREYGFVRPDAEQISEGLRVPPHQHAPLSDDGNSAGVIVWMVIAWAILAVCAGYLFTSAALAAGPGCPADPSFLGWCSDIPGATQ